MLQTHENIRPLNLVGNDGKHTKGKDLEVPQRCALRANYAPQFNETVAELRPPLGLSLRLR